MEHLSKAIAAVSRVGEVISRTAQSAQELLRDQDLRSKGIQTVISGAQTRLQGIQYGIAQRAGRLQERLVENRRQLQALLQNLEERFNASQRAWQLQARRRDRVDVQFGRQVIENAPQEVRARLWYVLLENPHLAAPLKCEDPGAVQNPLTDEDEDGGLLGGGGPSLTRGLVDGRDAAGPMGATASAGSISSSTSSRFAAAAAALVFGRAVGGGGGSVSSSPSATSLAALARWDRGVNGRSGPSGAGADPYHLTQEGGSQQALQLPTQQQQRQQQAASGAAGQERSTSGSGAPGTPQAGRSVSRAGTGTSGAGAVAAAAAVVASAAAAAATADGGGDSLDGWELVSGVLGTTDPSGLPGAGPSGSGAAGTGTGAAQPEAIRLILERLEALGPLALDESGSDPVLVAQQAVLEAMLQVPWEMGLGLPASVAPDCRFAVLNEMTAGQEEVDDSILRDIHRTFPEHPYFGMEAGQRSLFRVLKAYSLHDLEVAYCQGMAFMAGVLLMYVPEETAFRLFCRLMDPEGPNLRRLYLPGLEPLKAELATFELLLTWRLPDLAAHLSEYGLPPVLYVSQWLMTLFATPFPPAFCARVIDILLQDGHDRLLLRCSFAVLEALEMELLARHDFEALITYLKMEPVSWGLSRQRAIMDRALNSPLTDAEIDMARDTVANRKLLAAALAATAGGGAGTAAAAGGAMGPTGTTAGELLGADVAGGAAAAVAADPSAVIHQRQLGLEAELDAALTAAAAAALTAAEAEGGRDQGAGDREDCEGAGIRAGTSHTARGAQADMISFEEFGVEGPDGQRLNAGAPGGEATSGAEEGGAQVTGRVWKPDWHVGAQQQQQAAGNSTCQGGGVDGGAARRTCGGGSSSSYGMSPSLLDDLDFGCGNGGGAVGRPKAAELEYGEYGEMLVDAGVLLPVGMAAATPAGGDATAAAVAGDLLLD